MGGSVRIPAVVVRGGRAEAVDSGGSRRVLPGPVRPRSPTTARWPAAATTPACSWPPPRAPTTRDIRLAAEPARPARAAAGRRPGSDWGPAAGPRLLRRRPGRRGRRSRARRRRAPPPARIVETGRAPRFGPATRAAPGSRSWRVFMAACYGDRLEQYRERDGPGRASTLVERGRRESAPSSYKRFELASQRASERRLAAVLADTTCCSARRWPRRRPGREGGRPRITPVAEAEPLPRRGHAGRLQPRPPCPAVSVPSGAPADGLPIGLQVVARRWREDTALRVARAVEVALPEARGRPPV